MNSEIKSTIKHFSIYQLGEILNKAVGFLLIPIYTKAFTPEEYGILALILVLESFVTIIFGFGIVFGMGRSFYDYDDEYNRKVVLSTALLSTFCSASILFSISYLFSGNITKIIFGNNSNIILVKISLLYSYINVLRTPGLSFLKVHKKSISYTVWYSISFITSCLGIIYLVVFKKSGIVGVLIGHIISSSITLLIYIQLRKFLVFKFSKQEFKKMMIFGLPLIPDSIIFILLTMADRFFINHYVNTAQVGIYSLGAQFVNLLTIFLINPLRNIWEPSVYSSEKNPNSNSYYINIFEGFIIVAFIFASLVSIFTYDVLRIMSDKSYWDAYKIIPILFLSNICFGTSIFIAVGIMLKRKTKYMPIIMGIAAIINIAGNFLLVPKYGVYGAAFATSFSFLVLVVVKYFITQKFYRVVYNWRKISIVFIYSAIAIVISYYFNNIKIFMSVLIKSIIFALYLLLILYGGILSAVDRYKIYRFIKRRLFSFFRLKVNILA